MRRGTSPHGWLNIWGCWAMSWPLTLTLTLNRRRWRPPSPGRVDIIARQAGTGAIVVIENQLEVSDDSHLLRLLGYAANADANILVWIASDFTGYHRSILSWLNDSDTIDVYAVTVNAYHVGDALAAYFRTVVDRPNLDREHPPLPGRPLTPVTRNSSGRW